ncbi:MarR family transcriptional regulator [Clostridium algoriphilum]|uniref:MarR family winged helix-turn-helix transcriptional regulator n=1 Tax=Clostridium algoriphilum TaxID=198347 RepID=UPI001CF35568|nr:MarR family transcriptional regulator [Clostridium algoriphilum]MCB2295147.1 MarR family transcriptional regulator [Clostridium algoriphilum]
MDKYENIKLDNQLCFSLYATSREVIKLYKPLLDQYNLTYTQYITMLVLWEAEKISFKEVGQKLHLDSGTLTPVLKKLESMQLIIKYRDKKDDRTVIIELTEKGTALKENILQVPETMYCKLGGSFEKLKKLKESLDELLGELNS